jgi:hypothetical protein
MRIINVESEENNVYQFFLGQATFILFLINISFSFSLPSIHVI